MCSSWWWWCLDFDLDFDLDFEPADFEADFDADFDAEPPALDAFLPLRVLRVFFFLPPITSESANCWSLASCQPPLLLFLCFLCVLRLAQPPSSYISSSKSMSSS